MMGLYYTSGSNDGSSTIPALKPFLQTLNALLSGIASTAVKASEKIGCHSLSHSTSFPIV
ncbi:hypothetical protein CLV24_14411 [Pontibacter ummariensis]|uniref:Uncharacterized protein n=1 Tax=Pontibacter ummariensis TaxID=1610492 RepID=A0A239LM80_9BACT|nr:hypothetical protein CLV24_14411 [Pontibacter ummariensis]SNT31581.1 hypothetical protein SAMN06296052_14511 [Pontibacter ummariensis]